MGISYGRVLEEARQTVEEGLELSHKMMLAVADSAPPQLAESLNSLLGRKGKRIRATFLFLVAGSGEKSDLRRTAKVSAAIELLHLASLVHDDIIDESDLRRNESTAHKRWGNKMAVLLGDFALSKCMEMVWEDPDARIPLSISRASSRLVAGEVLELSQAGNIHMRVEDYVEVVEGKTGSLLQACGECGGLLAGFDEDLVEACGRMGRDFGIAFQVIDDLLDFGIGARNLGKQTHADLNNGFVTLPMILFLDKCGESERQEMLALIQAEHSENNVSRINQMLASSGAFLSARELAEARIRSCEATLRRLPPSPVISHLVSLCTLMGERNS